MSNADKIKLNSFDSLFGEEKSRITEINISSLSDFANHPFKVLDDEKMEDMVDSIKEYGVLTPIIVRAKDDKYEVISGHRRKFACEKLGITKIPAIIKELSDDEATILMVDSNIQREELLPSERAFSYKMKLDAMKRQGQRTDLTSSQLGTKLRADEIIAENEGISRNQIQRFIRLTNLNAPLLDMTDAKKLPFNTAVELSYLNENEQKFLIDEISECDIIPSLKQATRLKSYSKENKLDKNVINAILTEETETAIKINLTEKSLKKYFPKEYTQKQMEDVIFKLLDDWAKNKQ